MFYKYHVQHSARDILTHGQKQKFLAAQKTSFTKAHVIEKLRIYDGSGFSVWWGGTNQKLGGV